MSGENPNHLISRETYRKVKVMGREQMQQFLFDVYQSAYERAINEAFDLNELKERLSNVKGVGETRLAEIMKIIENYVEDAKKIKE